MVTDMTLVLLILMSMFVNFDRSQARNNAEHGAKQ